MPSSGLIKITPKFNGHVTKLTVKEGDHVEKGQLLYQISGEHYDRQGTGTFAIINQSLQAQYAMLTTQQNLEKLDNDQQQQAASSKQQNSKTANPINFITNKKCRTKVVTSKKPSRAFIRDRKTLSETY
ncbi:biotin/lipoyl-binding protein [Citrobacter freundii]|nr:biotin/lipoyl-binding protein [Citrobacter freundii]